MRMPCRPLALALAAAAIALPASAVAEDGSGGSGDVCEYEFATPRSGPSIVTATEDGSVWVALARAGRLGRIRDGLLREFLLPDRAFPVGIARDRGGDIWYTDINRNTVGRLDPANGAVREYPVPTAGAWPFFLVIDPAGHLWFTERVGNKLGRLDPETGEVVEIPIPTAGCQPAGLAVTRDGELYFTENSANQVGHYRPAKGQLREFRIPSPATPGPFYGPAGIAVAPDGDVWFCQLDGRLGRIRAGSETIEEYRVPRPDARPAGLIIDDWGTVWFTQIDANSIACFLPGLGAYREFAIPTGRPDSRPMGPPEVTARGERPSPGPSARTSRPFGIACDGRGRIWFSEQYAHKVGCLSPPRSMIFGPAGQVTAATAPIRASHRLDAGERRGLRLTLDGREIPSRDTLDLSKTCPGRHLLSLEFPSDPPTRVETEFVYDPSLATLAQIARRWEPPGALPASVADGLERAVALADGGRTDLAREAVRAVIHRLSSSAESADPARATDLMVTYLRFFDRFSDRGYEVAVQDGRLGARELVLEVGDRLDLRNRTTRPLHVEGLDGEMPDGDLLPDQILSHRFRREGIYEYAVRDSAEKVVGRVRVVTRTIEMLEFPMLGPGRVPTVLDVDVDGAVWFTAGGGGFSKLADVPLNNKIGRLTGDGQVREYETPTLESAPTSLRVDPRGRVWFTERAGNNIGCLDPVLDKVFEHPIPTPLAGATGLALDQANGRTWFTEKGASKFGFLDWATGKVTEYDTPSPGSIPSTIALDPAGYVWFDERGADNLIRHDPMTRETRKYRVPTARSRVVGITPDGHGHVWFLELGGHKVGRLDVASGLIREYAIPTPLATPFKLAVDGRGRVWFTEVFGNKVGVLDPEGCLAEFAIPTRDCMPGGIVIDGRGNIWFAEQAANKIGMIPAGALFADDACGRPGAAPGHGSGRPGGRPVPRPEMTVQARLERPAVVGTGGR